MTIQKFDEAAQVRMYGCTRDEMKEAAEDGLSLMTASFLAISMMSDAQEEIANNMREQARQTLNRAKWILANYGGARTTHGA